jgi:hypothetical protein
MLNIRRLGRGRCLALATLLVALLLPSPVQPAEPVVMWQRQTGTPLADRPSDVHADPLGNIWVTGVTDRNNSGFPPFTAQAFVSKYDPQGNVLWTRSPGDQQYNEAGGVSGDGQGNVYVTGRTWAGPLGGTDGFITRYDSSGSQLWYVQIGGANAFASDVSADGAGNAYVVGSAPSQFVRKYEASGALAWSRPLSIETSWASGVSADGLGHVYVTGSVPVDDRNQDAYISKFDDSGVELWTRQIGTPEIDQANAVSADALGNVYITGRTDGDLGGPHVGPAEEAFISKFGADGALLWTRQFGWGLTISMGIDVDALGNVFATGYNGNYVHPFVRKYDAEGNLLWHQEMFRKGTSDSNAAIAADGLGNAYFVGVTYESVAAPNAGGSDILVGRIGDVPEPGSLLLILAALLPLAAVRRTRVRALHSLTECMSKSC